MATKRTKYDEVNLSDADGVRYMHLGYTPWVQGAMRIARPWKLEIEYTRDMMCWQQHLQMHGLSANHIVQLGLGAASLTKYCYREFPLSRITVVELNPQVIAACRQFFKLPANDTRLNVLQANADVWVNDTKNHGTASVLQVDLYDSQARGPVLDSLDFYAACRVCLAPQGVMTVNVFGGGAAETGKAGGFKKSYANISAAFEGRCTALPQVDAGNVVVMAWNEI